MSKKRLILLGAGAVGRVIMHTAMMQAVSGHKDSWDPMAFVEKEPKKINTKIHGINIVSFDEAKKIIAGCDDVYFIASVGIPKLKEAIIKSLLREIPDAKFATVIHPTAVVMPDAVIEEGVYVGAHSMVSVNCRVKSHAMLNYNVIMGHDCVLGEYSVISPICHIAGEVEIGKRTFLGGGVMTYPRIKIGNDCIIGAGVAVPRDVSDNSKIILKPNTMVFPVNQDERQ